ncbi:hypothetical protein QTN25_003798 [Entamoeba marina]
MINFVGGMISTKFEKLPKTIKNALLFSFNNEINERTEKLFLSDISEQKVNEINENKKIKYVQLICDLSKTIPFYLFNGINENICVCVVLPSGQNSSLYTEIRNTLHQRIFLVVKSEKMKYLIASDYPFDWFTSPFIYVKRMKTLLKYSPTHLHIQELNEGSTNLTDFTCATNVTITINSLLSQKTIIVASCNSEKSMFCRK